MFLLSGQRELYEGYTVTGIDCTPDFEHIEFGNTQEVKLGKAIGDVDENIVKKAQIRRTIETHLDKELRYLEKGIKVLSPCSSSTRWTSIATRTAHPAPMPPCLKSATRS